MEKHSWKYKGGVHVSLSLSINYLSNKKKNSTKKIELNWFVMNMYNVPQNFVCFFFFVCFFIEIYIHLLLYLTKHSWYTLYCVFMRPFSERAPTTRYIGLGVMVFNATFNNYSVISWQSILLVEETKVPRNHQPAVSNWQTLSHNIVSSTSRPERDQGEIRTRNCHFPSVDRMVSVR